MKQTKGFLSIQFIIGISFFLLTIISASVVLIFYSYKYFNYMSEKELYIDGTNILDNFYNIVYIPNNNINKTFLNLIRDCGTSPYYSPSTGLNSKYYSIVQLLSPKKLNSLSIKEENYIVLYTPVEYNATVKIGKYNNSMTIKILRRDILHSYDTVYFDNHYYKNKDIINYRGKNFYVDYIDSQGYVAFLKTNSSLCGPSIPKYKQVITFSSYIYTEGYLKKYTFYLW